MSIIFVLFYKKTKIKREKKQLKIMIAFSLISTFFVYASNVFPILLKVNLPKLGHISFVFLVAGIWYAIVKFKLMALSSTLVSEKIIAQMMDYVFLLDVNHKVFRSNCQVKKVLGYIDNELKDLKITDIVIEKEILMNRIDSIIHDRNALMNLEVNLKTKYGNDIPVNLSASIIFDDLKDPIGIVLVGHDIREKRELAQKNTIFENQIKLAKKIQNNLIPGSPPQIKGVKLASIYQPMIDVGGDFFDFIPFEQSNLMGIFISDVSGHGVPAALITSMIKALIESAGKVHFSPKEMLTYINEKLFGLTNDNFITAFYGVYNLETKTLKYARAAHNFPYLISNNEITHLESKGKFLGVFKEINVEEEEVKLSRKDKILFFTDGLIEAKNNDSDFESVIEDLIINYSRLPIGMFVENIFMELKDFTGKDVFNDDVCIVGMEIE